MFGNSPAWGSTPGEYALYSRLPRPEDGYWHVPSERTGPKFMVGNQPGQARSVRQYRAFSTPHEEGGEILVEIGLSEQNQNLLWSTVFDIEHRVLAAGHWDIIQAPQGQRVLDRVLRWAEHHDEVTHRIFKQLVDKGLAEQIQLPTRVMVAFLARCEAALGLHLTSPAFVAMLKAGNDALNTHFPNATYHIFCSDPPGICAEFSHFDIREEDSKLTYAAVREASQDYTRLLSQVVTDIRPDAFPLPIFTLDAITKEDPPPVPTDSAPRLFFKR